MDTPSFAHLHVHTEYSLLDGSSKIKELVHYAKELGMDSLAITDHGVMYGVIDFYKACRDEGIHPVIGCEVYVAEKSRFQKEGRSDAEYYHLVLLAETQTGYQNLIKLVSLGFTEGFYYKPRVDLELLQQYNEGLIALSACLAGVVARPLLDVSYEKAKETALLYQEIFGEGNFFLELQDHGIADQTTVNQGLIRMSQETGIGLVATNDVHYTYEEDRPAHDILLCIQTNKKVDDTDRMRYEGGFYLKSPQEMAQLFPYAKEALLNTETIAKRCQVEFTFHELKLPAYDVPSGFTPEEYLRHLCEKGLKERYPQETPEIRQRLEYELNTIISMGYVDYFLIVWDFINFARTHGIMVGPGRGSGAGSIVAYCLHITNINPLNYQLIFERFLNPERISMPDIDVDFCYRRRQEVIDYVVEKYGEDRVAQIITFGTMAARLVIRDVGRALDMTYAEVDKIAKMIPFALGMTIDKALTMNPELASAYESDEKIRYLIDMSKRLEGLPRHSSTHAAGVVISKAPVVEYVPVSANDGVVTTQFTMNTLEELGLLKMDFLGLRTLTVIQDAIDMVKETEHITIDVDTMPMDDEQVYQMISAGKTDGVFQLESAGMTAFMRDLKPENLEDIIAGISLYRPGPMEFIPKYVKGKRESSSIQYTAPQLEPILKTTYGCIVYQEQVMQIVRDLAGYTMGRSDLVRRAMSKKKADVMAKERQNFVFGNEEEGIPGIPQQVAETIFDEMTDFAKYAFNKSHAAAYAVVAYQTAWLKYHYPVEFMAALLTSVIDHSGKVSAYIQSCRAMEVAILPPDINEGYSGFSVSVRDGVKAIRYGLSSVKNVGHSLIDSMVEERKQNGPFSSLMDFCRRMQDSELNKRALENLIKAGAFDSLGGFRSQYIQIYQTVMAGAAQWKKAQISGQIDLFGLAGPEGESEQEERDPLPDMQEFPDSLKLSYEKEVLGLYLTGHPLAEVEDSWRANVTNFASDFKLRETVDGEELSFDEEGSGALVDGQEVVIGGIIMGKTVKATKNNKMMAFISLEDLYGSVEVLVFPNDYEQYRAFLEEDQKIYVRGRVSVSEEEDSKLICQQIVPFGQEKELQYRRPRRKQPAEEAPSNPLLWLRFATEQDWLQKQALVCRILEEFPGPVPVRIYLQGEKKKMQARFGVSQSFRLLQSLRDALGEANVALTDSKVERKDFTQSY